MEHVPNMYKRMNVQKSSGQKNVWNECGETTGDPAICTMQDAKYLYLG